MAFFFGFYLWGISDATRAGPTIVANYTSPIFAFADANYLLAANAGGFETIAASGLE